MRRVLIANRGEIALRIIAACRQLGVESVGLYSAPDRDALHVQAADRSVCIGPAPPAQSYLAMDALLMVALGTGCDAVHPGYGFLAENADFADAVAAAGMIFVGPDGDSIRLLGDKVSARQAAAKAGVPTVPGSDGRVGEIDEARGIVEDIGFPVMIKAVAGGGGRGIRVAADFDEFERFFPQASAEAAAAFGDGGLYIEKLIDPARHIEVQVLGDGQRFIHCFERECSLQRRRQKIWEEAPAFDLAPAVREAMCASAVALAKLVGYRGAGTVEFLYDSASQSFYFIEVNTRIQVEHPVTEMITGIDLVQAMIRIAGGEPLAITQDDVTVDGHAIECRINAEDPAKNFMPGPGTIESLKIPEGEGIRFDTMLYEGYVVPPFYDSLLGKLIVRSADRESCLVALKDALAGLEITGIPTTVPLHALLVDDLDVAAGRVNTRFLETWLERRFETNV